MAFFNFTEDVVRVQASMGEFKFENEEVVEVRIPADSYVLLSKAQPGRKLIADRMNVTIGVLGTQEQEVEAEEEAGEDSKTKYLSKLADQCSWLNQLAKWIFYPPLAILAVAVVLAFCKKLSLSFLWLWLQFVQLFSLTLLLQVGLPKCLVQEISFYSLLNYDPFAIRGLYSKNELKAPLMANFAYHHISSLDFLYNGPLYVLGFCLMATIMIFIIFAALIMPQKSKGGHVAT